ncbi:hypothetical protein F5I97DRAFT_1858031 [Phlebopus sp. FC_14]|nr:hypothetical protein F5I97DRAFT_1858031 [Phlebopus sp. FC_14]
MVINNVLAKVKSGLDSCNSKLEKADREVLSKLQSSNTDENIKPLDTLKGLADRTEELEKAYRQLETENEGNATKIKKLLSAQFVRNRNCGKLEARISALESQLSQFLLELQENGSNQGRVVVKPPTPPSTSSTLVPETGHDQPRRPPLTPPRRDVRPLTPSSMTSSSSGTSRERQPLTSNLPNAVQSHVRPAPSGSQAPQNRKPSPAQSTSSTARASKRWPTPAITTSHQSRERVVIEGTSTIYSPAILGAEGGNVIGRFVNSVVRMGRNQTVVYNGVLVDNGFDVKCNGQTYRVQAR